MPISAADLAKLKKEISSEQLAILIPKGVRIIRPLQMSTPLSAMGLSDAVLSKLSPEAKKLTKGDLVSLWKDKTTPTVAAVSVKDLNLIKGAFGAQIGKGPGDVAMDIYCCCCPCCCATAVVAPMMAVA